MSLIFDRTKRKNRVTRELYYDIGTTQFQFLDDDMISVWGDGDVWLMNEIGVVYNEGWVWYEKCTIIYPDGSIL